MPAELKFKPEMLRQIEKIAALGATDMEIAEILGISVRTFHRWKHEHEGVQEALKLGKDGPDQRVERSLYNRAVGYSFESEKIFQHQGAEVRVPCVEHVPPDPKAAEYWLNNRRPDLWKSRVEHQHGGKLTLEQLVTGATKPE